MSKKHEPSNKGKIETVTAVEPTATVEAVETAPEATEAASAPVEAAVEAPAAKAEKPVKVKKVKPTIEELQALYLQTVGRATTSQHMGYLRWKIGEAKKGHVTVGPVTARAKRASGERQVLPLSLLRETTKLLDAACDAAGFKTRSAMIRQSMIELLNKIGTEPSMAASAALTSEELAPAA
jgi:hypothetical protein